MKRIIATLMVIVYCFFACINVSANNNVISLNGVDVKFADNMMHLFH